jgi:ABC-type transport system involved in cytochrome bd biosynthesis fused ATPase/permease subunit
MENIWSEFKWLITTGIVLFVLAIIAVIVLRCTGVIGPNSMLEKKRAAKAALAQQQTSSSVAQTNPVVGEAEVSNSGN